MNKNKPNLFIAGIAKAGTTVLANYLAQHPDIFMSKLKEPDFFSSEEIEQAQIYYKSKPVKEEKDYLDLFKERSKEKWLGEASVSYFFYKDCAKRIKRYSPEAKVILIVRHPIDRAYSHYLMDKRLGFVKQSFEEIICNPKKYPKHYDQYISQGFYYDNLAAYTNCFGNNLLILSWKPNIEDYLVDVYRFLNLKHNQIKNVEANKSLEPKSIFLKRIYANETIRKGIKKVFPTKLIQSVKSISFENQNSDLSKKNCDKLECVFREEILKTESFLGLSLESKYTL